MNNQQFIEAISACNGDPAKIAIVLNDKIQVMIGNLQLDMLDLLKRFIDHEKRGETLTQSGVEDRAAIHEQLDSIEERIEERIEGHEQ